MISPTFSNNVIKLPIRNYCHNEQTDGLLVCPMHNNSTVTISPQ